MNSVIKDKLVFGSFVKNAGVLTLGTIASQGIVFAFYPILTRLYTPAEFGVVSVIYMITSLLAVIASGAAEGAILIATSRQSAANVIGWIVTRSSIVLLAAFIIAVILSICCDKQWIEPSIQMWLPVIPFIAATTVYFNCISEWILRERNFSQLTSFRIHQSIFVSFFRTAGGVINITANGLVIGEIFGKILTIFMAVRSVLLKRLSYFRAINKKRINVERSRYKMFPRYMMPDQLINITGGTAHIPFFGLVFGSAELGYISMTMSLLYLPVTVISSAIKDVFRQRAARELQISGSCRALYLKLLFPISAVGLIGFGSIYLVSPWLFTIILGDNWAPVGEYTRILIPMFFLNFVSMSMGGVLVVTQRLGVSLGWQIANLSLTLLALFIGAVVFKSVMTTLWGITIAKSVSYILHIILSYRYSASNTNLH